MATGEIIVANDERHIRDLIIDRLRFRGFDVRGVADGEECVAEIERQAPDLVVLDAWMPRMGGLEVLDWLQHTHPEIPVVMVSAVADREVVQASLSRGAADYVVKPFQARELEQKVFKALGLECG